MKTSLHAYQTALHIHAQDVPFYALVMAAMIKADTLNAATLRAAYPGVWDELSERYNSPGGKLEEER